ncbi:MAG TPA: hypothetical protein EYP08_05935 [Pyrodictiaceae archaeon]|nr:hypothetical protein [Pyrodictiaceae archaeon]HIQ10634.1 hypothetical protein [Pyrodictium sp.]HIQ55366.1 hypothetical protein [Pyrodictium sp.]
MFFKTKTWRNLPLEYLILEELERRGGRARDSELYEAISGQTSATFAELLKALMKLEMQGLVEVIVVKEDVREVRLARQTR